MLSLLVGCIHGGGETSVRGRAVLTSSHAGLSYWRSEMVHQLNFNAHPAGLQSKYKFKFKLRFDRVLKETCSNRMLRTSVHICTFALVFKVFKESTGSLKILNICKTKKNAFAHLVFLDLLFFTILPSVLSPAHLCTEVHTETPSVGVYFARLSSVYTLHTLYTLYTLSLIHI